METMYELTKNFRFESAHRLAKGYKGKCKNMHGHSWNGNICLTTTSTDQHDMSVDYATMGVFCKELEKSLDHKTLVWIGDKDLIEYLNRTGQDHYIFDHNPTCETIAAWVYANLVDFFRTNPHVKVKSVTIHETCTTGCTYYKVESDPKLKNA